MAVVAIVEFLAFGVIISVISVLGPRHVEPTGAGSDAGVQRQMQGLGIERRIERRLGDEGFVLSDDGSCRLESLQIR